MDQKKSNSGVVSSVVSSVIVLSVCLGLGYYFLTRTPASPSPVTITPTPNPSTSNSNVSGSLITTISPSNSGSSSNTPAPQTTSEWKNQGRYIKITQPNYFGIDLSEIEVFSTKGGPNVITPNTVTSSSQDGGGNPSKNLVDGDKSTFTDIKAAAPNHVLVDLGSVMPIYQINVYNRTQCCQLRISGAVLTILDSATNTVYTSNPFKDQSGSTTPRDGDAKGSGYGVFTCYPPSPDIVGSSPL